MNFQFYFEKLQNSDEFKSFMKENSDAFLCSCFFIVDKQGDSNSSNQQHFDYFLPQKKEMFSFQLENGCKLISLQAIDKRIPEKIFTEKINFDFNEIEKMILAEMKKNNIKNKIQKIIFSLQRLEGKDFLLCTVFVSTLGLLKVNILLQDKKIVSFEKKSFFDMVNIFKKK